MAQAGRDRAGDTCYLQGATSHQATCAASGNGFLEAEAQRLLTMLQPDRRGQPHQRGRMIRSLKNTAASGG